MRKVLLRWWLWFAVVLMGGVLAACLLLVASSTTRITPANCDNIQPGMTSIEVETLLGGAPSRIGYGWGRSEWAYWSDDLDNTIAVRFSGGRVTNANFKKGEISLGEQLRRLAKRILGLRQ